MKKLAVLILVLSSICFYGCFNRTSEVYVPKAWNGTACLMELRNNWVVNLPSEKFNINDENQLRALVKAVWEADRAGKTQSEIRQSFEKKSLNEILTNGL